MGRGQYIMDRRVIILGKCQYTMGRGSKYHGEGCQNTIGKWEFIPLVGWSIYDGEGGQNTMGRDQYSMGRGIKISWVGGLIYHC